MKFSTLTNALRDGEPISAVLPHRLFDRFLYHQSAILRTSKSTQEKVGVLQEYDYLFYLSAVIATLQLTTVRNHVL